MTDRHKSLPTRRQCLAGCCAWAAFQALARRSEAQTSGAARPRGTADVCVFVNLLGAPSHTDTFDLKPGIWTPRDADLQPGAGKLVLSRRLFPLLLQNSSELCVLRSVESYEAAHERGQFYVQTGHSSNPAFNPEVPHIGAVVAFERPATGRFPAFLSLNSVGGEGSKFLGGRVEPVNAPTSPEGFFWLEDDYYGEDSLRRFNGKFDLLKEMDAEARANPYDPLLASHAAYYETARGMMYEPAIADVFRLSLDDRGRYGDNGFGRSCIVARNAIRAANGARFISIASDGWDMHQGIWDAGYGTNNLYHLCGEVDRGVGSLIADLRASGRLARTLIVMMGEFGRTPGPLNSRGGRDHHKNAMFCVMAGGGVRGGMIVGETDRDGLRIIDPGWSGARSIFMEDIAATIYSALGIDWTKKLVNTPSGRSFEYVKDASIGRYTAVDEVFA